MSYKAPVPVVVVGNIVVGGAGKTPLVIGLAKLLMSRNYQVGIVSRGFARHVRDGQDVLEVRADSGVNWVGDEPLMIKRTLGCPVFVGKHRAHAVKALLAQYPQTTIVLCDDGLQHYRLNRDIEIAVLSANDEANTRLLPAGPLREPLSRLANVDLKVMRGDQSMGYEIVPVRWRNLVSGETRAREHFAQYDKSQLSVIIGIARPDNFIKVLGSLGIDASLQAFPDHFIYTGDEVDGSKITLTTEKDAVKLQSVGHFEQIWVLEIEIKLSEPLERAFLQQVDALRYQHQSEQEVQ